MHSPIFSLEVFPPKRTSPVGTIYDTLDGLQGLDPDFISVTYGTGKSSDRTLTARIAHTVNEYGIPAVAHLTAQYLDKDDVDEALDLFDQAKVSGVLALRGDRVEGAEPAGVFDHASDLAAYIREKRPNLKIYGACYPEKHPQAATLEEDIDNLKKKVDAGADYIVTQMFFDNQVYFRFVEQCREAGITVPIIPGIKPVGSRRDLATIPQTFHVDFPPVLVEQLGRASSQSEIREVGVAWCIEQTKELLAANVPGVHYYTLGKAESVARVVRACY